MKTRPSEISTPETDEAEYGTRRRVRSCGVCAVRVCAHVCTCTCVYAVCVCCVCVRTVTLVGEDDEFESLSVKCGQFVADAGELEGPRLGPGPCKRGAHQTVVEIESGDLATVLHVAALPVHHRTVPLPACGQLRLNDEWGKETMNRDRSGYMTDS